MTTLHIRQFLSVKSQLHNTSYIKSKYGDLKGVLDAILLRKGIE